ncbi:uncharacterized protein LOC100826535 [Brachypodium distachyon]|uniref:Bifunctional inhibitor/plant lipid transfer protein/seed storage helical domain-containing protein n=1 Tax=Brachypodium distachyon TaxID=15368 RepID=A0A2K2DFZ4_BRADI|nr:uncharacterized protein LOC100826535 [Brachypodium distachyon]PNT73198.1 hypothetical protein BRADI_2g54970v3 [Brachypodium distachyon]|eukprot:XP_003567269.2 uncharacterized protein LOC100826535 [Brachypodium distachyon]
MHDPNQIFKQTNDGFHPRPRPEIPIYIPLARRRDDHHPSAAHRHRENSEKREVQQQEMEFKGRCLCFLAMLLVVAGRLGTARGAGECGRVPVDRTALKLAPCAAATQNPRAAVPPSCCAQVRGIGRNPKCLCAVMLSNTARQAGVKPAVAMTIPKRCAIANRPIGYKCGPYTLP